jgi:hypothetical protein
MAATRALVFLAVALAACSVDSEGDDEPRADGGTVPPVEEFVFPRTGQTGFDGTSVFRLPVGVSLDDVTWTVDDPAIVSFEVVPRPEQAEVGIDSWAMLTTLAPGTATMRAENAAGRYLLSTIVVAEYDAADVEIGRARYNDDDGSGEPDRVPCASCHLQPSGADHSPLRVSVYRDAELLQAITTGMYPDGATLIGVDHTWDIAAAEEVGIVAYLRTLPPRGF